MTQTGPGTSLIEHFSALKDPRQIAKVLYPLPEILLLVLCATLAGADDFVEVRPGAWSTWTSCAGSCRTGNGIPP